MSSGREEAILVLGLAVDENILSQSEAAEWVGRLAALPPEQAGVDWLVEQGVLSEEQAETLAASVRKDAEGRAEEERTVLFPDGRAPAQARFPSIPGYQIVEVLGAGGMGVVFKAWQNSPRRLVALKVMKPRGVVTEAQRMRFEREAQAAADLSHPGVVTIYELGELDREPYIAMELVDGVPLTRYIRTHKPALREGLELMQRICEAVAYAHQKGVIHRDLKPANIMVQANGQPKILDFGLAKLMEAADRESLYSLTVEGQVMGTVPYMAPEQTLADPKEIDVRTDVYALGVILYQMLTGRHPQDLKTTDPVLVMEKIRQEPPLPPTRADKAIDDEVETIVLKALEKEKERRYQSADALAADIRHYLAGEPIEAKRASTIYQLRKLAYRHRTVLIPSVAALVAIIAVLAVSYLRVRSERNVAERQREAAIEAKEDVEKARTELERESYFMRIALAGKRIEELDFQKAEERLDDCPAALRHWDWGRLKRLCHLDLATFAGHKGPVWSVAFSPDGGCITSASLAAVKLWDVRAKCQVAAHILPTISARCVAFSPDGTQAVLGDPDNHLVIWDLETGRERAMLAGHGRNVNCIAFSPDGERIASGSADMTVKVWDAEQAREVLTLNGHVSPVRCVAFSPDAQHIASGSAAGSLKLWDAATGGEIHTFQGSTAVGSVAFSPDGQQVAAGSSDGLVKLWHVDGALPETLKGHSKPVTSVAFCPDGSRVASGSWDRTVKLWDVKSGRGVLTLTGHDAPVTSVAFSPEGELIASGSVDNTVRLWSAEDRRDELTLKGHRGIVSGVAFGPDGKRIATGGQEGTVKLWDAETGREVLTIEAGPGGMGGMALSPDGRCVAFGTQRGTLSLCETASGCEIRTFVGHANRVASLDFSHDGTRIVSGSWDGTVKVWNAADGAETRTLRGHSGRVSSVAFSPDGRRIASAGDDMSVRLWNAASGQEIHTFAGHADQVLSVAFNDDGTRIVTGGSDRTVRLWDAEGGGEVLVMKGHSEKVLAVAFSPDGERIVSTSEGGILKLWDTASGREVLSWAGHANFMYGVAFSPDGARIAASADHMVRIWDTWTAPPQTDTAGYTPPASASGANASG